MRRKKIYERHCAVHRDKRRTFVTLKKKLKKAERLGKDCTKLRRQLENISCLMMTD